MAPASGRWVAAVGGCLVALCLMPRGLARAHQDATARQTQDVARLLGEIHSLLTDAKARSSVDWLSQNLKGSSVYPARTAPLPDVVVRALEADRTALQRSSNLDQAPRQAVVDLVNQDLQIKSAVCRKSAAGMSATITLKVQTWDLSGEKRKEAHDWKVMYLPEPLALFGEEGIPFAQLSSPTTQALPPGLYVVWVQDPANKSVRGQSEKVPLGDMSGKAPSKLTKDLVVTGIRK